MWSQGVRNRVNTADYKFRARPSKFFLLYAIWWTVPVIPQVARAHNTRCFYTDTPSLSAPISLCGEGISRSSLCVFKCVERYTAHTNFLTMNAKWLSYVAHRHTHTHTPTHTHIYTHLTTQISSIAAGLTGTPTRSKVALGWLWHIPRSFQVSPWDTFVCFF